MPRKTLIAGMLSLALCLTAVAQDQALVIARYRQMLEKNPGEGIALDRLWKLYQEKSATSELLADYRKSAGKGDFPATLVLGLLLQKAGQLRNPLPHCAMRRN